jgi:hypothetical protein
MSKIAMQQPALRHLVSEGRRLLGITSEDLAGSSEVLNGHDSEATAYVVDDYPYGFTARTKIRYWLEYKNKKGARFVSQTLNPKTQRWNAPKASTYAWLGGVMFLDMNKHVQWDGLSEYSSAEQVTDFLRKYPGAKIPTLKVWAKAKAQFAADLASGKKFFTINGVKKEQTPEEIKRNEADAQLWADIAEKA